MNVCLLFLESPNEYAVPDFLAKPAVVVFADYSVGHVYEVRYTDQAEEL